MTLTAGDRFLSILLVAASLRAVVAYRPFVNYTGRFMLGALFPIHSKGREGDCGNIQLEDGIQPLEAMLYTLDKINNDDSILPGIKLGLLAFDSCDNVAYSLEQSLDFVKGFIARFNEHHEQEFQCGDGSTPKFRGGGFDQVIGVVGGQSSSISIQVATLLRLFNVSQVSYLSTSAVLSDKARFPYFFRTVPSDVNQAQAMLEILRKNNWTYASVVYSDNDYGIQGFENLNALKNNYSVCFSTPHKIDLERFTDSDYDKILLELAEESNVVVVFAEKQAMRHLLHAARRQGLSSKYLWIGSDAWSSRESVADENEEALEGALAVQPLVRQLEGFDDYFTSLSPNTNNRNPWFHEYWETYFNCSLSGTLGMKPCSGALKISKQNGYKQQRYLHFIRDAVHALAHALNNLRLARCGDETEECSALDHIEGEDLKEYLGNVTFKDESGKNFRFVNGGDGPPRYSVLNFQRYNDNHYHWAVVGNFSLGEDDEPMMNIDFDAIQYRRGQPRPEANCAQPCLPSHIKQHLPGSSCCWKCEECKYYQRKATDYQCEDCPLGHLVSKTNFSICVEVPEKFIDYQNPWAIGAMAIASLGIFMTVFVSLIFWTYSETPVIKASGRELSYLLLLGTLLSFCVTFVIVARPTNFTCGLTRFFLGFCYTLCYAAMVTKTNRIARIFSQKPSTAHKTRYTSPKSQLVITALLTSVEVIINISWLLYEPPTVTHINPSRDERMRICEGANNYSYMVGLIYPFILIGFCTIYAIKTRKCPGGFNETRYIAFTNYTTLIIWLAFVPLYLASTSHINIRVVTLAISLSLSGLVQLGCLFYPKIYIVLLKPEKNTKEVVMSQHRSSSYATPSNSTPVVVVNGGADSVYMKNMRMIHGSSQDFTKFHENSGMDDPSPKTWRTGHGLKVKEILEKQASSEDVLKDSSTLKPEARTM